jgi:Flp pilus assembly protein TadD
MIQRFYLRRLGMLATVLAVAGLTGCLHFDAPFKPAAEVADSNTQGSPLKTRQVADVEVAMGRSFEKQGDIAQAIAAYEKALQRDPSRPDACLRLAILRDQQGKFKEAFPLYQKALAVSPGNPDVFCDMGYSLYLQHRFAEAEINLRQAVALAPEHARAHNNLGLVFAHMGRYEEALVEFRRAGCSEADAQINLAFALTLEKDWQAARERYQIALAIDASSSAARKGLRELDAVVARTDRRDLASVAYKPAQSAREQTMSPSTALLAAKKESNAAGSVPAMSATLGQPTTVGKSDP